MPNLTSNFSFNKPLVNDATDEDLWGGYLNDNWDDVDNILPVPSASKYGAVVVQSTDDAGFEILSSQGTSGQILQSNGADALPSWVASPSPSAASESASGIAELLTNAEFLTGTDSSRIIVASNFVKSIASTGYITLPGGLVLQWGLENPSASSEVVTFPVAFASSFYAGYVTIAENAARAVNVTSGTTTQMTVTQVNSVTAAGTTNDFYWFAIGK